MKVIGVLYVTSIHNPNLTSVYVFQICTFASNVFKGVSYKADTVDSHCGVRTALKS